MDPEVVIKKLKKAFSSEKFLESTGPGANTIPKLHARISAVSNTLRNQ
jgi:hypothetical protein